MTSLAQTLKQYFDIAIETDKGRSQRLGAVPGKFVRRFTTYKKMANQEEILVFIQKDGIPVATAELFAKNRIGQFYADEHSGTPEVFTTWLRDKPDLLKHVKKHVKLAEVA